MFIFVRAPGLKNKPSCGGRKTEKVYSTGMLYLFKSFEIKKKDERIKLVGRLIKCVCLLKMSQLSPAELALCVVRDIVVGPAVRSACRSLTSLLIISSIDLCLKRLSLLFGLSLLNVHGLRIFHELRIFHSVTGLGQIGGHVPENRDNPLFFIKCAKPDFSDQRSTR